MASTSPVLPARALAALLSSSDHLVLLDARPKRPDYDAGHLAGARHVDANRDLSSAANAGADPARGGRHPLPALDAWCRTLGEWGISPASHVVVYDGQAGANAAARTWWMLRSAGHENVSVLDGGLDAAREAGISTTSAPPRVDAAPPYPAKAWLRPTADIDAVDTRRSDPAWRVLDVRARERFAGEVEPIDAVAGHIPGAVNLFYGENLSGGRYKAPGALRALYEELLGGVGPDRLIVHCGSGVTACHTLLALEHAGMTGATLYVGSWSEWSRNGRPIARAAHVPAAR